LLFIIFITFQFEVGFNNIELLDPAMARALVGVAGRRPSSLISRNQVTPSGRLSDEP
jgi:hypothetical protein